MNSQPTARFLKAFPIMDGPLEIVIVWAELENGWPEPVGLTIRSFDPALTNKETGELVGHVRGRGVRYKVQPLTATLLHDIPWRQKFDESLKGVVGLLSIMQIAHPASPEAVKEAERAHKSLPVVRKPKKSKAGRPPEHHDDHYQKVAKVYLAGGSKGTKAVMESPQFAKFAFYDGISRPTASRWVAEARRRGFLPPIKKKKSARTKRKGKRP